MIAYNIDAPIKVGEQLRSRFVKVLIEKSRQWDGFLGEVLRVESSFIVR